MNGLGFVLLNSGKVDEAKPYFEKCLEKEPDAAGPMNGLARCLKEEGKVDEAIALWEKMAKTKSRSKRRNNRSGDDVLGTQRVRQSDSCTSRNW